MARINKTEIQESKIRQAIWMLKVNKTKKQVCEHLGIAYNTKRLDTLIQDFHDRNTRIATKTISFPTIPIPAFPPFFSSKD